MLTLLELMDMADSAGQSVVDYDGDRWERKGSDWVVTGPAPVLILQPPEVADGGVLVRQLCIAGCEEPAPRQVHMLEAE